MNRIAIVAGGWHWPYHFYEQPPCFAFPAGWHIDLFVVAHRSPELPIVRSEKRQALARIPMTAELAELDREMYSRFPTVKSLRNLGWSYQEAENTVGDWGFFNQWLESHEWREYDLILNCHDDTYWRSRRLFADLLTGEAMLYRRDGTLSQTRPWLILGNGCYREAPAAYVRGSFEVWSRELLVMLGGRIELGSSGLDRMGYMDSPVDMEALSPWNALGEPLRRQLADARLDSRVLYLSPHYRISRYAIEGERGFMSWRNGAPWSFEAGLRASHNSQPNEAAIARSHHIGTLAGASAEAIQTQEPDRNIP